MDSHFFPAAMRDICPAPMVIAKAWDPPEVHDPISAIYRNVGLGDQGYFWAFFSAQPERFYSIPVQWEVSITANMVTCNKLMARCQVTT
jgi:hypothetical protein